jgi:hypothetical protein
MTDPAFRHLILAAPLTVERSTLHTPAAKRWAFRA